MDTLLHRNPPIHILHHNIRPTANMNMAITLRPRPHRRGHSIALITVSEGILTLLQAGTTNHPRSLAVMGPNAPTPSHGGAAVRQGSSVQLSLPVLRLYGPTEGPVDWD